MPDCGKGALTVLFFDDFLQLTCLVHKYSSFFSLCGVFFVSTRGEINGIIFLKPLNEDRYRFTFNKRPYGTVFKLDVKLI